MTVKKAAVVVSHTHLRIINALFSENDLFSEQRDKGFLTVWENLFIFLQHLSGAVKSPQRMTARHVSA